MNKIEKIKRNYYGERNKFKEAYLQSFLRKNIISVHPNIPTAIKRRFAKVTKELNYILKQLIHSSQRADDSVLLKTAININAYLNILVKGYFGRENQKLKDFRQQEKEYYQCCLKITELLEEKSVFTEFCENHPLLVAGVFYGIGGVCTISASLFTLNSYMRPVFLIYLFVLMIACGGYFVNYFTDQERLVEKSLRAINRNTYAGQLRKKRQQEKRSEVIQKIYAIIPTLLKK